MCLSFARLSVLGLKERDGIKFSQNSISPNRICLFLFIVVFTVDKSQIRMETTQNWLVFFSPILTELEKLALWIYSIK
jgi:hypothetical protein